ncbi:hypothetical protein HMPREF3232_01289 [Fannyhessea vaginae]|nr:hypothetical protein HMPREF3232_01289 [Fannyhessea vaginae]
MHALGVLVPCLGVFCRLFCRSLHFVFFYSVNFFSKISLSNLSNSRTYIICKTRRKSCKSEYKTISIRYSA